MGQQVSFISSLKVKDKFYTEEIKGTVTDISFKSIWSTFDFC